MRVEYVRGIFGGRSKDFPRVIGLLFFFLYDLLTDLECRREESAGRDSADGGPSADRQHDGVSAKL